MKVDTQDQEPEIKEKVDKVGIEGIRTDLQIQGKTGTFSHLPTVNVMISLGENKKGIHMSRLAEAINEIALQKSEQAWESLEAFGHEVLKELAKKHPFHRGEVTIHSTLILEKTTPASEKQSREGYDVTVKVVREGEQIEKYLQVSVIGATACPHSQKLTGGKSHIQRAKISLGMWTDFTTSLPLEKLIRIAESSFSAPTYSVVKSEDERYLVDKMYDNPKFVEDIARECLSKVKDLGIAGIVRIRTVAYESIHKHNAVSEIERKIR